MTDLLAFLKDEWNVFTAHPWTFIIFGAFVFGISWAIHNYMLEVKLHDIPGREALQQELDQYKNQVAELEKALHRQDIVDLIQEVKQDTEGISIGAIIAKNK